MKKKTTVGLLGLAAAGAGAAGGWAALGNYLYNQMMLPQARDPEQEDGNPAQNEGRLWARGREGFREATIQSLDGLILWAALIPGRQDCHRWAVCVHGYHDTYESMGAIARHYSDLGWHVLMPDQRGHGQSEGDYVGWGYDERLDLVGWCNYIVRKDPEAEIVLHGVSMGAATVLMATGGALPRQVKAAVSDCAYTTIEAEARHVLSRFQEGLPTRVPLPSGLLFAALRKTALRRAGFDLRDAAPIRAVARSKTPTLFIHGVEDDFVPAAMMGKLYQAAKCPKSFLWMPGAGHAASVGTDPRLYWTAVSTFLSDYFPEPEE
ncbi:MAG: alpha/beta hydrolase [Clostridiales bacterium]|nr:alpha/beta hydrolase [Clostridiales bacterium]